jgi:hypothetical protein
MPSSAKFPVIALVNTCPKVRYPSPSVAPLVMAKAVATASRIRMGENCCDACIAVDDGRHRDFNCTLALLITTVESAVSLQNCLRGAMSPLLATTYGA